ncbi:hypothetical protein ACHHYP_17464 [Achlya hypogyna]|uniref:Ankyrin repeat protein n=1 Tax=Achlya hypogyna TaxID=1202772 RepID=A0A1V9Y4C6_ACHHY|nr:hypothetical protein ACHHYP_17464 [Achlya hypogyna]
MDTVVTVLQTPELLHRVIAYQHGLTPDILEVWRLARSVRCTTSDPSGRFGTYSNIPDRFWQIPYVQQHAEARCLHEWVLLLPPRRPGLPLHISVMEGNEAHVARWLAYAPKWCTSSTVELAVVAGQPHIVRQLLRWQPSLASPYAMDLVAMTGDMNLLQWFHQEGHKCTTTAMDGAAMNGHLDVVRFLHFERTEGCTESAATAAIARGHAAVVEFLIRHQGGRVRSSLSFKPLEGLYYQLPRVTGTGHAEAVMLLYTMTATRLEEYALLLLVRREGLALLQFFVAHGYLGLSQYALEISIERRDTEMFEYIVNQVLHDHGQTPLNEAESIAEDWLPNNDAWEHCNAIDKVAFFGDLATIQVLHRKRFGGCSAMAMDMASTNGHLHVLEWLRANRHEGCTANAIALAAARGHSDVVRWLHEVMGLGCTSHALSSAAAIGDASLVTYLLSLPKADVQGSMSSFFPILNLLRSPPYERRCAVDIAAEHGHVEILRLLKGLPGTSHAIEAAVRNGHLHVVQYLHEERSDGCDQSAYSLAMAADDVPMIKYLLENRCFRPADGAPMDIPRLYLDAASNGRIEVMLLVSKAYPCDLKLMAPTVQHHMMELAATYGHLPLLRWLHTTHGFGYTSRVLEAAAQNEAVQRYLATIGAPQPTAPTIRNRSPTPVIVG